MDQEQLQKIFWDYFDTAAQPKLRPDGTVDVFGSVKLMKSVQQLPLQFHKVTDKMDISAMGLVSLVGSPPLVNSHFDCSWNMITSLQGAPQQVGGDFNCAGNELRTLQGAPIKVQGDFNCAANASLVSLEGLPREVHGIVSVPGRNGLGVLRTLLVQGTELINLAGNLTYWEEAEFILNKYKSKGWAATVPCARELIRAGYKDIAKL